MRTAMCLTCCLLFACAWPLHPQERSVKDTVLANERRFSELQIQRKCEEAAQFLAEDFQGTGGPNDSKSDFLNTCKTGGLITTSEKFSNVEFRLNAPNTAVVAYLDDGDFILNNKPIKAHTRVDSVWVKHGSKWLMHLHTSSTIPFAVTEEGKLKLLYFDSTEQHDEGAGQKETARKVSSKAPFEAQSNLTIVHLDPGMRLTPFEQMLLDKEKEVLDRSIKRDFAGWEGLISDDALAVYSDGYATKADVLEAIKTMTDGHCVMDKVKFNAISKKAGLITYRMTQDWKEAGKAQSRQYYVSSLWVNRSGKWIGSFWQETDTTESQAVKAKDGEQDIVVSSQKMPLSEANAGDIPPDAFFVAKEKEDWEALKNKDKAAAARLLADDFVGMYDTGYSTKSEWLKQIDGRYTVDDYRIEDVKVLRPNPTTTLLLYKATCKGTGEWSAFCSRPEYISDLFVERNGQWVALFSQDTQASSGESDDVALKAILSSENQIVDALSSDDIEGFGKFLPDDIVDIDTDGVKGKSEWLKGFERQKKVRYLFRGFRFEDPKLIRLGPDAAILTAKEIIQGLDKGKPFEDRLYTMACYLRRNGKWVPIVYQDTPIQ
jgi:ketosteroid isomerase-like protein